MSDINFISNASATYEVIEQNGPPTMPLPFDKATVGRAVRVDAPVLNPITNEVLTVSNIIYEHHNDGRPPERAYWVGRKLKKCIFGVVKECTVLKFRNDFDTPWEVTEEKAAGKIMSWQKIRDLQHIEDPQKEVAAMQFVSREFHPNVMGVLDVLQDEEYLLLFMPFCNSGDLFGFVQQAGRFPEPMARFWFKQILEGLAHLQKMGVCHRDMSLENILIDEYTKSLVIDLGMCLRVPYLNDNGEVGDVSGGGLRRLIAPLIPCGKPNYISPEVLTSEGPFDGFAIDMWACGVILFIMLVGLPPWEFARPEDPRYKMVTKGKLAKMLNSWQKPISPEAADLLQRMLMENPRDRLSLMEVRDHPWVMEAAEQANLPRNNEGWRG